MYVQLLKLILGTGFINSLGIVFGIAEEMEQYSRDIYKNSQMKFLMSLSLLTFMALNIRIILLIASHSTGEYYRVTEFEPLINCALFQETDPGTERRLAEAHYLLLVEWTVGPVINWLLYIIVRWAVINPQLLANDMSTLYRAPKRHHSVGASRALRSITILSITLTIWLITRYGYHVTIYLLILSTMKFASCILSLFNLFQPGNDK